jgi:MFS family permease
MAATRSAFPETHPEAQPGRTPETRGSASGARQARPTTTNSRGGIFSALRYRNYRLFWFGQVISVTGTFMQGTAQQWLVLTLSPDPLALGLVGAFQFGPVLVLAPFGGIAADRWERRKVLMATQASAAVLAFTLWILTATNLVQLWHVFVLAFLLGLVNAFDMPTRQAFVSEMVGPDSLLNAVSLNSAQFNVSRILGPGIAGALIWLLGVPFLFLGNALSFLAVIAGLALMRPMDLFPVKRNRVAGGMGQLRAMGEGIAYIRRTPVLWITLFLVGITGTFGFNFNVLLPLEAKQVLNAGPQVFGLVSSALGAGALVGALFLARRRRPPTSRLLVIGVITFGLLEALLAFTNSDLMQTLVGWTGSAELAADLALADFTLSAMVLIALVGLFMSMFSASANTRTQLSSPPELRGRVMSIYMMLFAGTTPIGNLLISAVAGGPGGVSLAWVAAGLPCVLAGIIAGVLYRRVPAAKPAPAGAIPAGELETVAAAALGAVADTPAGKIGRAIGAEEAATALGELSAAGGDAVELPPEIPELVD